MQIINTQDPAAKPPVAMVVYGEGGTGKTTFSSTSPKPVLADIEGGSKYFGLRGIKMDVGHIKTWSDFKEFCSFVKENNNYETVVIDPIGELMELLKTHMILTGNKKNVQSDGNPTMAGWGWMKDEMRRYLKGLLKIGKNILIIAHVEEPKDEDRMLKRPKLMTKLSDELVNMVDVVGYMTMATGQDGESKRVILVDAKSDKYVAKDRTGQLGGVIEPDFSKIVKACQGTETYKWSKPPGDAPGDKKPVEPNEEQEKKAAAKEAVAAAQEKLNQAASK